MTEYIKTNVKQGKKVRKRSNFDKSFYRYFLIA